MTSVTVGLPFRNDVRTLPLAIRSVFAQDFDDWELFLVDDGSRDGSLDLARSVADDRVRVLSDGGNRGLSVRLNQIAQIATGRYVARMDADDAMYPTRLSRQVGILDLNPTVQVIASRAVMIDARGRVTGMYRERALPTTRAECLVNGGITHSTVMARTSWSLTNPYDAAFLRAQDQELWCRAFAREAFEKVSDPLLFYRVIDNGSYEKYRQSRRYERRVMRAYGPSLVGRRAAWQLITAAMAKQAVFGVLSLVDQRTYLSARKSQPLLPSETSVLQGTLDDIASLSVPGLCAA